MPGETIIQTVFSNGLRVKLKQQLQQRTVNLGVFIAHGAKDETPEVNGIAHYIEHVLFNPNHMPQPTKKLLNTLLGGGAQYEAYTSKEYTRFTVTCLPEQQEQALSALSQLVSRWHIDTKAMEHERPIILQEHAMHFSSSTILGELLDKAFWGDRSLGLFVIGRKENIHRFTKQELEQRASQYYSAERTHLVALGPLEIEPFVNLTNKYFGSWMNTPHSLPTPVVETEPSISALPTNQSRVDLIVGYVGVPFSSSDRHAVALLADVLGGGMRSRLFLELREKHQVVYLVHAYSVNYGLGGYLAIRTNCEAAQLPKVYALIQQELERIKTGGITEAELVSAKAARTTAFLRVLENSTQHLQILGNYSVLNDDFFVDLEVRRVAAVQTEHIMRMAREILIPDHLALVALGPKEETLLRLV